MSAHACADEGMAMPPLHVSTGMRLEAARKRNSPRIWRTKVCTHWKVCMHWPYRWPRSKKRAASVQDKGMLDTQRREARHPTVPTWHEGSLVAVAAG